MNQKKVLKGVIIFILIMFLLSTGLVSVMYFVDKPVSDAENLSGDILSGNVNGTGKNLSGSVLSGGNNTGKIVK